MFREESELSKIRRRGCGVGCLRLEVELDGVGAALDVGDSCSRFWHECWGANAVGKVRVETRELRWRKEERKECKEAKVELHKTEQGVAEMRWLDKVGDVEVRSK